MEEVSVRQCAVQMIETDARFHFFGVVTAQAQRLQEWLYFLPKRCLDLRVGNGFWRALLAANGGGREAAESQTQEGLGDRLKNDRSHSVLGGP